MVFADFQRGHAERLALRHTGQILIEQVHELRRAGIVNIPKRHKHAVCAGLQQSAHQTQEFVASDDYVQPRAATTERYQFRRKLELV